jgi:hypothetical protein
LREGYIETFVDYMDEEKHYTLEEVKIRIEQLNK